MTPLIEALSGIFLPIILGLLSRNGNYINPAHRSHILQFAIRICIPFMVFETMRDITPHTAGQLLPMTASLFLFSGLAWLLTLGVILFLAPRSRWVGRYRAELLLIGFTGNIGYICWKIQEVLIGPEGLQRGIFYTSFFWPVLFFYALCTVFALKLTKSGNIDKKGILYNVIPLLTMLFLGLTAGLTEAPLPSFLTSFTGTFGAIAVPTILFCMGLSIHIRNAASEVKPLLPFLLVRFVIWITATWIVTRMPFLDTVSRRVLLINSLAPIGVNPIVIADMFGLDTDFVASSITVSTLIYLLYLPFLFILW
ncbi:MAG: hypothetical protein PQJ50_18445 [Spirochaetales bacterium]|nr:hypothetical protein [Spirochaetales bacterium]